MHYKVFILLFWVAFVAKAQHTNTLTATINDAEKTINVNQEFTYVNSSGANVYSIFLNDWNNAYADKNTALTKRLAEEFKKSLHLASGKERGITKIYSITNGNNVAMDWKRTKEIDIIRVRLQQTLAPGDSITLKLIYDIKLPDSKFTKYGFYQNGEYYLKDWYLTPAVYDGSWRVYSNKNLEDLHTDVTNTTIAFAYPKDLKIATNFDQSERSELVNMYMISLNGTNRKSCEIFLKNESAFTKHVTPNFTITTDIDSKKYDEIAQGLSINKITQFLTDNLGAYPHKNLLVSTMDYNKNPLYGVNQLPSFVSPYEEQFQFELKVLKTALDGFLKETLFLDPRAERWVNDAIANYLMIKYVEQFYPDTKLIGKLSKIWGIRGFHFAKMDFNEQYNLLQMMAVRKNIDQALSTPNDSLIKFNQKIANRYKAGLGLSYLADYTGKERVDSILVDFYQQYKLRPKTTAENFKSAITFCSDKDLSWFFEEYVNTRKRIDFKIKKVTPSKDSIAFTIKNKRGTNVPISLFGLQKDSVVSKYWFMDIDSTKTFTIPNNGEDRLVLNYDQKIPEFNQRDNWKSLNGFFSSNKKLQFRFFKDTEDPNYTQIFYVPIANFNIYDGVTPGVRFYNKTFLERQFLYDLSPTYSFKEKTMVGKASVNYRKYHRKSGHYMTNYYFGASTNHFQENSRFTTITPAISWGWRPDDLIPNKRKFLTLRHRNVFRSIAPQVAEEFDSEPDYSVLNLRYSSFHDNILKFKSTEADFQYAKDFIKVSMELEYRKLFNNNRQLNLRFYGGAFLRNVSDTDFYSFSLDRPTDYMFDLNYLGRSEDTGLFSQQIIIAEGGFKSRFEDPFGSDWITTANASFNLWRWIEMYGDIGYIKNQTESARFVYDSGIRLNLVTDYFELYFPLYSNKGWEIAQPDYARGIRFIVTLSPRTLTGLFTRKWF